MPQSGTVYFFLVYMLLTLTEIGLRVASPHVYSVVHILRRSTCYPPREDWMIYRGPSFLAGVWFGSTPSPPPPVSKLSLFISLPMWRRYRLLTGEEGQESLDFYNSFYSLYSVHSHSCWVLSSGHWRGNPTPLTTLSISYTYLIIRARNPYNGIIVLTTSIHRSAIYIRYIYGIFAHLLSSWACIQNKLMW